jgi:hypothetical protein
VAVTRIVDSAWFSLEAAYIDWLTVLRQRHQLDAGLLARAMTIHQPTGPFRGAPLTVALRWHLNAGRGNLDADGNDRGIGLPTGPFTVWRRPSTPTEFEEAVGFDLVNFFGGIRVARFDRRLAMARLEVDSPVAGTVFGLTNPALPLSIVTRSQVPSGHTTVEMHGADLAGVLLLDGVDLLSVRGVASTAFHDDSEWKPVEIVGLPVDPGDWAGVGDHAADQGLVGALGPPIDAALSRLARGTPPFGWDSQVEAGVDAPLWRAPDGPTLLDELHEDLIVRLRDVLVLGQLAQAGHTFATTMPPPSTLDGNQMPAADSTAHVSPVAVLQTGVSTDPFLSLALGYGTNIDEPERAHVKPYHDGSTFDYMVTAPYARGLDGESDPLELVAYAPRPVRASLPPVPTALVAVHRAHLSPDGVDEPWGASADVTWQRPPKTTLFRVASYGATRHDPGATVAGALMEERDSGGHRPIAPGSATGDPDPAHCHLTDRQLVIPNDPGTRAARYAVSTQSLFGIWSPWRIAGHFATQPQPIPPSIVAATLNVVAPPAGKVCPGTAVVDLTWDWTDRRPASITILGRLYAAPTRGAPPPGGVPLGFDRSFGGGDPAVQLVFAGDAATVSGAPGATIQYLNLAGEQEVAPGPAQGNTVRRYRLTIPGFQVDFGATQHAGLALWITGIERLAPGHQSGTVGPTTSFVSDPVAPEMPPPIVPLGSLPDAEGRSHGRLAWPPVPGASGYLVYSSDEFTMLTQYGIAEPSPDASLSDRFDTLLDAFEADPDRRPFTRLTPEPVLDASLEVLLTKGSRAIHTYVVITVSPGAAEGPWPTAGPGARDSLRGLAAPRVAALPPPELVAQADPAGTVSIRLTTGSSQALEKVDLHRTRVDDAARSFETMGPPIASVSASGGGWTVTVGPDGRHTLSGTDSPGTSWRRVWYRAVAWGGADPLRGVVRGRSVPSNPFSVVIPPGEPPDLSPVVVSWPGGGVADVQLDWTSLAPVGRTALGPHLLQVQVVEIDPGPPEIRSTVLSVAADLDRLSTVPDPTGNDAWRVDGTTPQAYRAVIRRTSQDHPLAATIRLVDPLGRASQQRVDIPAGPVLPAPDIADVDVVTVSGVTILTFTSGVPLISGDAGPYVLRVAASPRSPFPFPFPFEEPEELGPVLRPRPSPGGGIGFPRGPFGPLRPRRPAVVEIGLPDVPVLTGLPPTGPPLAVGRAPGAGPRHAYGAIARFQVARFEVLLTSPDGRTASASRSI